MGHTKKGILVVPVPTSLLPFHTFPLFHCYHYTGESHMRMRTIVKSACVACECILTTCVSNTGYAIIVKLDLVYNTFFKETLIMTTTTD